MIETQLSFLRTRVLRFQTPFTLVNDDSDKRSIVIDRGPIIMPPGRLLREMHGPAPGCTHCGRAPCVCDG
jgi:hypothetical protein